jgi:hypothetical protein
VRWHSDCFRRNGRWKSRSADGPPQIDTDLRASIRRMRVDNPLWGAPRIRSKLLKRGFEVAQSSVAKYMIKQAASLRGDGRLISFATTSTQIAAMDLFVTPSATFEPLSVFIIIGLACRDLVWINAEFPRTWGPCTNHWQHPQRGPCTDCDSRLARQCVEPTC